MRRLIIVSSTCLGLAACGGISRETSQGPIDVPDDEGPAHIHGLGVNPADRALFIATHTGLFRAAEGETAARRVGDSLQDTMGFTVVGPDTFLGSGHPGEQGKLPPLLGLIRSDDAGATWKPVSLLGEADFHVLRAAGDRVYGFDSTQGRLMVSDDGGETWQERRPPAAVFDLALDPADLDRVLLSTEEGLYLTDDAGRRWRPKDTERAGLLAWTEDGITLVDGAGAVHRSADGDRWSAAGQAGGRPAALSADGPDLQRGEGVARRRPYLDASRSRLRRSPPSQPAHRAAGARTVCEDVGQDHRCSTMRLRALCAVAGAACALAGGPVAPADAAPASPRIVVFDELPSDAIKRFRRAGVRRAALFPAADSAAIVGSAAAYRRVRRWKGVVALYPERSFKLATFQTKPSLGVDAVHAGGAPLSRGFTGRGVTVAVFDTGIESTHPDLDDRVAANLQFEPAGVLDPITDGGYSSGNPETPHGFDELQHGTLVAGIVAGTGESAKGADMRGMAPDATLVNFKLIGQATHEVPDDSVMETNALASYQWMIDHRDDPRFPGGIRLATNSWGWDGDFEPIAFTRMLESARDAGIALVFAAGNSGPGPDTVAFPGRLPWIITVGASCKAQGVWSARCPDGPGQVADFSSRGAAVDVLAPGVDTWGAAARLGFENTLFTPIGQVTSPGSTAPPAPGSESPGDEVANRAFYLYGAGTSFATPHVAGIVALMLEANRSLTQAQIEQILQRTATDLGPAGFDPDNGHGHVNAFKAVELAAAAAPPVAAGTASDPPAPARRAPRCTLITSRAVRLRSPRAVVRCDQAASLSARLTLPKRVARRLRIAARIGSGSAVAAAAGSTRIELRLAGKARKRLRRLSRSQLRKLRPTLTVVATGATGDAATAARKVRLSR